MSDEDIITLQRMSLKKVFESEYWTQKLFIYSQYNSGRGYGLSFGIKTKRKGL